MTSLDLIAAVDQLKTRRPDLAARASKALALLQRHLENRDAKLIVAHVDARGELTYHVKSGSNGRTYHTTYKSCDCPDACDPRRSGVCYHQLAIRALEAICGHEHGAGITPAPCALVDEVDERAIRQAERAAKDARSVALEAAAKVERRSRPRQFAEEV